MEKGEGNDLDGTGEQRHIRAFNPYIETVCGDWYFSPIVRHTGSVYLNDLMMYECSSLKECQAGNRIPHAWNQEEAKYLWYTEQDGDETVLYANFQGKDPNAEKVEISVRRNVFMPDKTGMGYITVSGFNITKAATTWAPPAAYQDGMIGPHWSRRAGSLRTVKSATAAAAVFPWASTWIRKMTCISSIKRSRARPRWSGTRSAADSITAG